MVSMVANCTADYHVWSRLPILNGARCDCGQRQVRTPPQPAESAAMRMALQPNLNSLDALLAAIRALQCQADHEMNRVLEQNAELRAVLMGILDSHDRNCSCAPGRCSIPSINVAREAVAKRNTRTGEDVADDRRALIDELPDDPDYTGGGR